MQRVQRGNLVEGTAVAVSMVCAVHCLALPLLLLLIPGILGLYVQSESFHLLALALLLPFAASAFWLGYKCHASRLPMACGLAGVSLLVCAVAFEASEDMETVLTLIGTVLLVTGHGINWQRRVRAG